MSISGSHGTQRPLVLGSLVALASLAAACGAPESKERAEEPPTTVSGSVYTVRDTTIAAGLEVSGMAEPIQRSTLGTKLLGTVVAVYVKEGDAVRAGQSLARIDDRDLGAKHAQLLASIAEAEAVRHDAQTQAGRIRGLYADSAATRAQLDAVETAVARAEAGVRAARAASDELAAVSSYASVRAPFSGTITRRFVDPGAFAAPGAPIVTVEDASQLRVRASAPPSAVRGLRRGDRLAVSVEGTAVTGVIEGVVPTTGSLYAVNVIVSNRQGALLAGSAATVMLSSGTRRALVIPTNALTHEGELTGVTLRTARGDETRWVRVARLHGDVAEISGGLVAGDQIVVPLTTGANAAGPGPGPSSPREGR